ncbi:MAG: hypothetical protein K2J80_12565 [Oscillospiraceae bacterium]|nr:hypothetical protein [Oscillospiraceae bacterium]
MNQMFLFANGFVDNLLSKIFKPLVEGLFTLAFGNIRNAIDYANHNLSLTPAEYAASDDFSSFGNVLYNGQGTGMIDKIIQGVIMPVATVILVYVVLYEFITALIERNSFREFDTAIFIRFIFKTTLGIYFLTHAMTIVNALFDLGTFIIGGVNEEANPTRTILNAEANITTYVTNADGVTCVGLLLPALLFFIVTVVMFVGVYVCLFGRMMEIFLNISIAPIPMATITNRDLGDMGKNYVKLIFSFVLQAFFILLAITIFGFLCSSLGSMASGDGVNNSDINKHILEISALGIVLILSMFKSGSLAKSILNCH